MMGVHEPETASCHSRTEVAARRRIAEGVEEVGGELLKLSKWLDNLCLRSPAWLSDAVNEVPHQEQLEIIASALKALGARLWRECDEAEEADDLRRDNPLEPDFRRLGQ